MWVTETEGHSQKTGGEEGRQSRVVCLVDGRSYAGKKDGGGEGHWARGPWFASLEGLPWFGLPESRA